MRQNIWSALLSASDQEIHDGLAFYPGAHGLCRFFAHLYPSPSLSPRHIAGIYAALSPLNTWDTNVANILDLLRDWSAARVNTTDANLHKALRIRCGEDPETVLSGRKVRSFFRCIADPDTRAQPPAIDRHLINLALGLISPSKREQANLAHDDELYSRVERAYMDLGAREGLGNRLASIAWFVQRRMARTGQHTHRLRDSALICCGKPMWRHGSIKARSRRAGWPICTDLSGTPAEKGAETHVQSAEPGGFYRWYCSTCKSTRVPEYCLRLVRTHDGWHQTIGTEGLKLWRNKRNRTCVTLHPQHPYANSGGWQYLARFLISEDLGSLPRTDEHTHHTHGLSDDRIEHLELVNPAYHGQLHASAVFVGRAIDGRFRRLDEPYWPPVSWPRNRAVLGNQALTPSP